MSKTEDVKAGRIKRVVRLKKAIIMFVIVGIVVPWIFCGILFVKVYGLNRQIDGLYTKLDDISAKLNIIYETKTVVSMEQLDVQSQNMEANNDSDIESYVLTKNEDSLATDATLYPDKKRVYLTFDDGPSAYTDDILNILDTYDIKATFFVVGKEDDNSKNAILDIVDRGHSLGMHSYSHKYSEIYESKEAFMEDFYKLQDYLFTLTGSKSTLYRFPGGSSNKVSNTDMYELIDFLDSENITFFDWNISSGDGDSNRLRIQTLCDNSVKGIEDKEDVVILLHDSYEKPTTVEALPLIIEKIMDLEDVVFLPITDKTKAIQHIKAKEN